MGHIASETTFDHWKVIFSWGKARKRALMFQDDMARFWNLHIRNPHIKSDILAKTESLLIFVEQKMSSGPMLDVKLIVHIHLGKWCQSQHQQISYVPPYVTLTDSGNQLLFDSLLPVLVHYQEIKLQINFHQLLAPKVFLEYLWHRVTIPIPSHPIHPHI